MRIKIFFLAVVILCLSKDIHAQSILNGDFENNTAGVQQINLSNGIFNSMMPDVHAFGWVNGGGNLGGDMDIINTNQWCNFAESNLWFVSLTGGGSDAIALSLSSPLIAGQNYTLSFWDESCGFPSFSIQIGLSNTDSTFGTLIYSAPIANSGTWTERTVNFTPLVTSSYITVSGDNTVNSWVHVDNFVLVPQSCSFTPNDTIICENQCIQYINTSGPGMGNFIWDFPGGSPPNFIGDNPPPICYNVSGNYVTQLIGNDTLGNFDTAVQTIYVVPCAIPLAHFATGDSTVCRTDCVQFTDLSSGFPTTWQWTFPGGTPHTYSGQQPPLICFDTLGGVLIHLVISNIYGVDSVDLKITIVDCAPNASFNASNTTICHNDCITYTNTSTANCTSWSWLFAGGVPAIINGAVPPPICYANIGNFVTKLIVTNAYGSDTVYQTIHVLACVTPVAFFGISDTDICKTDCITFTNSSAFATGWNWYFPGGGPSSSSNQNPPAVCYPAVGDYLVRLIVTNAYGADTNIQHVHVHDCIPYAAFSISDTGVCIDSCINFTNLSSANAIYKWTFNGGTPSSFIGASPPSVCYHMPGVFAVKLVVTTIYGADSVTHFVVVHAAAALVVTPPAAEIHLGETVQLNAGGGVFYWWTPGMGLTDSTINNPVASPMVTTTYFVTMTDADGCGARDSVTVFIIPTIFLPSAFSPNGDGSNDVFRLLNPQDVLTLDIKIFNRWGQLIYQSNTPYFEWDGTKKSTPQEVDVYVWEINVLPVNSSTTVLMKGNVSLIR